MKSSQIKALSTLIIPVAIAIGVFLIYKKFFRQPEAEKLNFSPEEKAVILKDARTSMSNGKTYGQVAEEIYNHLYAKGWLFGSWFKNTDEKLLGNLLLTVEANEYDYLGRVYLVVKQEYGKSGMGDTLTEDLKRTFSKTEEKLYLSHLKIV